MSGQHAELLYVPGSSTVHRLAPEVKILSMVLFTIVMVATPRQAMWTFGGYAVLLAAVTVAARIRPLWLLRRGTVELPFIALSVLLPFMAGGRTTEWLGVGLSVEGLYGAWNIIAKATLGVWACLLLAGTTTVAQLLAGLDRLRCPAVITQIAGFMVRYVHVLLAEAGRMRVARLSRGDNPRFLWQVRALAGSTGTLFLRSYERGERVYLAMLSRGYTGRMPLAATTPAAGAADWSIAALLPVAALALATAAWVTR